MAARRAADQRRRRLPRLRAVSELGGPLRPQPREAPSEKEAPHVLSGTAVAAEALRSGVLPASSRRRREAIPGEAATICLGDPDDDCMSNEYVGEDTVGASSPTPDQNGVDDIGRAYGLQEEDTGALRSSFEVLQRRDRHRSELRAPRGPRS